MLDFMIFLKLLYKGLKAVDYFLQIFADGLAGF